MDVIVVWCLNVTSTVLRTRLVTEGEGNGVRWLWRQISYEETTVIWWGGVHNSSVLLLLSQVRYSMIPGRHRHSTGLSVTPRLTLLGLTSYYSRIQCGKCPAIHPNEVSYYDSAFKKALRPSVLTAFPRSHWHYLLYGSP